MAVLSVTDKLRALEFFRPNQLLDEATSSSISSSKWDQQQLVLISSQGKKWPTAVKIVVTVVVVVIVVVVVVIVVVVIAFVVVIVVVIVVIVVVIVGVVVVGVAVVLTNDT